MPIAAVDLPPLCVRALIGAIDEEKRTAQVVFSTGAPVLRYDYMAGKQYREVLSMEPSSVQLERLNTAGPLLDTHSAYSVGDVLGTVEPGSARIEKGQGVATVRFSRRDAVTPIWQDVVDRIITAISVGYRVFKYVEDSPKGGGIPTRTAINWEPHELSMVPMPADIGAKVRGGDKSQTNRCEIVFGSMTDGDRNRRLKLAIARASIR